MEKEKTPGVFLGGLWKGPNSYSGKLGMGGRLVITQNKQKKTDKDPDLYMTLYPEEKKEASQKVQNADMPF